MVEDGVAVHLIEFFSEERFVLTGNVDLRDAALDILVKIRATLEDLICEVYVSVNDVAYMLYLVMCRLVSVLGVLVEHVVDLVVDRGCESIDHASFPALDTRFHRDDIISFGLSPSRVISFELRFGGFEIVAGVVLVSNADRAYIERFDILVEISVSEGEHMQNGWLRDVVTILGTSFALCEPDGFMSASQIANIGGQLFGILELSMCTDVAFDGKAAVKSHEELNPFFGEEVISDSHVWSYAISQSE